MSLLLIGWADWSFYSVLVPLFMCHWSLVCNVHVYGCKLFVLWRHQASFICHFITIFWYNVAFNTNNSKTRQQSQTPFKSTIAETSNQKKILKKCCLMHSNRASKLTWIVHTDTKKNSIIHYTQKYCFQTRIACCTALHYLTELPGTASQAVFSNYLSCWVQ